MSPQTLGLYFIKTPGEEATAGHAVTAYKYEPGTPNRFYMYDPNFPCSDNNQLVMTTVDWSEKDGFTNYSLGTTNPYKDYGEIKYVFQAFSDVVDSATFEKIYEGASGGFPPSQFFMVNVSEPRLQEFNFDAIHKGITDGLKVWDTNLTLSGTIIGGEFDGGKHAQSDNTE